MPGASSGKVMPCVCPAVLCSPTKDRDVHDRSNLTDDLTGAGSGEAQGKEEEGLAWWEKKGPQCIVSMETQT